ncbi:MarR family transcriptional regulator [Haloterrigena sp. SYSU A121-1]|uniref:MarR family transcriptional regulator n=1 Tax=Haloterrigena gelatinilytica TaxID=2741724 RepID=A0A8J8GLY8_9EURY|nr:MarR family transcriptional regulator [Haloterrigena gelatinilytica]NUB92434.1 MarR family transcriptional regulator [Haloterrigena gelatinilytica]
MTHRTTSEPLEDLEFLARSEHRVAVLEALAERPTSRAELRTKTGASASTIGRTLRAFDERNWIRRDGDRYETTQLGAFVAVGLRELLARLETERTLRDSWQFLPEESGFTVEMASRAIVTVAEPDAPYRPVNRFAALLERTNRFRFVGADVALLEPCKDELRRSIVDGMEAEIIDPPAVAEYILSNYREHCSAALESGNLSVSVHDDVPPCGVSLFDDRIAVSGYDPDSGMVRLLIDTDAPEARDWAESTFATYRDEARPLALGAAVG